MNSLLLILRKTAWAMAPMFIAALVMTLLSVAMDIAERRGLHVRPLMPILVVITAVLFCWGMWNLVLRLGGWKSYKDAGEAYRRRRLKRHFGGTFIR